MNQEIVTLDSPPHSDEGVEHRVAVVDVEMVPAALRGEVIEAQADGGARDAFDQPRALGVQRVVSVPVRDVAFGGAQPATRSSRFLRDCCVIEPLCNQTLSHFHQTNVHSEGKNAEAKKRRNYEKTTGQPGGRQS